MGLSDILAMLMQHGGGSMSPGGGSFGSGSMLPRTNLPTPQPLAHMNGPDLGQVASQMPGMAPPSALSSFGSALSNASGGGGNYSAGMSQSQASPLHHGSLGALLQALGLN